MGESVTIRNIYRIEMGESVTIRNIYTDSCHRYRHLLLNGSSLLEICNSNLGAGEIESGFMGSNGENLGGRRSKCRYNERTMSIRGHLGRRHILLSLSTFRMGCFFTEEFAL